jgi:hypothetical protein
MVSAVKKLASPALSDEFLEFPRRSDKLFGTLNKRGFAMFAISSARRTSRALAVLALGASATPLLAQANPYVVTYDLRVHGTNAKSATVAAAGNTVTLDLFAHVFGTDGNTANDGFQTTWGSFKSSNSSLTGDLLGLAVPSPFNGSGSSTGSQTDFDGDGDLEVGAPNSAGTGSGAYFIRSNSAVYTTDANGDFFIGQIRFTATSLAGASTTINYFPDSYTVTIPKLNYGFLVFPDARSLTLRGDDLRAGQGAPVTIYAQTVIPPGTVNTITGTISEHLTVSGNVAPAVGSVVNIATGIDVTATGAFDTHGSNYNNHQVNINDSISGNTGGSLAVASMTVGASAAGVFTHSAGITNIGSQLNVGAASNGTVNVTGGTFYAANANINSGSIHQTGGIATFGNITASGSNASYTLDNGDLSASHTSINSGSSFIQNNGTSNFSGGLGVGSTGAGALTINGGALAAPLMTFGGSGPATVVQNGGTVQGIIHLGWTGNSPTPSTYTLNNGTIVGSLILGAANGVFIQNGGTVSGEANSLDVRGPANLNARVEIHAGQFTMRSVSVAWSGAPFFQNYSGGGSVVQSGGTATLANVNIGIHGVYTLSGGNLTINKTLRHYGTLDFANSTASLTAGSTSFLDFSHGQITNATNATVTGLAGSLITFAPGYDPLASIGHFTSNGLVHVNGQPLTIPQNAAVHGSGTIEGDVTNNGTLSPGNSPGELDIVGNFAHTALANLEIELAGNTSDLFDIVTSTGTANLQGILSVNLLGDYVPLPSDQFAILKASKVAGRFSNATSGIDTPAGHFDVLYTPTSVTLANFSAVPEPTAALLLAAPLLLRRRRR